MIPFTCPLRIMLIASMPLKILAPLVIAGLIRSTLWLLQPSLSRPPSAKPSSSLYAFLEKLHRFPLFRGLRWFSDRFPQPLRRDLSIVAWVFIALFWLAQWQGTEDAWRDVVNRSSTRPIVTLVSPSDKFALGATLDDEIAANQTQNPMYPPLKNLRIFGDVNQFRSLYAKGITQTNGSPAIVWRLLIESGNWLYLFPALPDRTSEFDRPPVVAVNTGDGRVQSLILSRPKVNP
jgi:hypothetical protein